MRHASQSEEAPPTSCSEVFQGGACDNDGPAPSSLARSSSASDVMEPFIVERVKGEDPQGDPASIPNPTHRHSTIPPSHAGENHAAQPLPHPPPVPSPNPLSVPNGVAPSSSEGHDDGSVYDQFWEQIGSRSRGSSSDWVSDWDSAFLSSEKGIDDEEGEMGPVVEEEDLFSSIRDYLTNKGSERKEEAGEREGPGRVPESSIVSFPTQVGMARAQREYPGPEGEARQVLREDRQVSEPVRHSSVDSTEENEAEQCSIYECLELQCQWPSPIACGVAGLERLPGEKTEGGNAGKAGGWEGKCDAWGETGEEQQGSKEVAANVRSILCRQDANTVECSTEAGETAQTSDPIKAKTGRSSTKRHHSGGVHVSFRPSTESVQFHNPLESKEAHWKARLRRLSHFHTHSHSAGERPGAGGGAGSAGKFGTAAGISHRGAPHEKSGSFSDNSGAGSGAAAGGPDDRGGTGGYGDSYAGPGPGSEAQPEASSGSSGASSGVRGRLGRSALRSRASRSRSQEPGSTASRHHQGALLGGVYKTVVHALSSKPRPRGQGSSQGSSPQRQGRAATGDASLRDLYSHVLGYFGRKTATPGEDGNNRNEALTKNLEINTHQHIKTPTTLFLFWLFFTGLL